MPIANVSTALRMAKGRDIEESSPSRWRMRCPSPDHRTRSAGEGGTASFYVHVTGPRAGEGKCYGCGMTTTWSEVVQLLGLPRDARFVVEDAPSDVVPPHEVERMLGTPTRERHRGSIPWPPDQAWRGVSGRLVNAVGGILVPSRRGPAALRLPCTIRGQRVGHIDCTLNRPGEDELGYVNSAGTWAMHALWPYDHVRTREPDVVVLVEGARDALVTIQNGCQALATLGSTNWSRKCVTLMRSTDAGTVVIMADPDDAGDKLRQQAFRDLSPHLDVRCVELPWHVVNGKKTKLMDPADLSRDQLRRVLARVGVVKHDDRPGYVARSRDEISGSDHGAARRPAAVRV